MHAVTRRRACPRDSARAPQPQGAHPCQVAEEMDHAERQRSRVVGSPPGAKPRHRPLQEQQQQDSQPDGERRGDRAPRDCRDARPGQQRQRAGHERSVRHHHGSRHVISGNALRMPGEDVQSSVADAELLPQVAARIFAPSVHADGGPAERQPVSRCGQPVAQVVVRPVADVLVEQAALVERAGSIGGVSGADVIRELSRDGRVALLEIAAHHAGPEPRVSGGNVVALCRGYARVFERSEQRREPAVLKNDVLIDLADDRMLRFAHARIEGGGRSAPGTIDQPKPSLRFGFPQQARRSVAAAVVDRDDLERPAVALRLDTVDHRREPATAVVDRHHEADAHAVPITRSAVLPGVPPPARRGTRFRSARR